MDIAAPIYLQRAPRAATLAPLVERFWYFAGHMAHHLERMLPDPRLQLLVNLDADELRAYHGERLDRVERLGGAALGGARLHSIGIDTAEQRRVVGVSFHVAGSRPFFQEPVETFTGAHVELDRLWGRTGATLRERLLAQPTPAECLDELESVLLGRAVQGLRGDATLAHAIACLDAGARVTSVAERLGVTGRHLSRRFRDHVGFTPKRYARVARMQRAARAAAQGPPLGDWARFALEHGFYDQAHLVHEFRELAGMTPSQYCPRTAADANHAIVRVAE